MPGTDVAEANKSVTCHMKFALFVHSLEQIPNVAWSFLFTKQRPRTLFFGGNAFLLFHFFSILPSPNTSYIHSHPALRAHSLGIPPCPSPAVKNGVQLSSAEFLLALGTQLF